MQRIFTLFVLFLATAAGSGAQEILCKSQIYDKIQGRIVQSDTNVVYFVPFEAHDLKQGQCGELVRMNSLKTRNGGTWGWGNSLGEVEVLKDEGPRYLLKQISNADPSSGLELFLILLKMDLNTTFEFHLFDLAPCEISTEYWPNTEIPESRGCNCNWKRKGRWLGFTELGELKEIKNYVEGELTGEYVQFNTAGDTIITGEYLDHKKTGIWTAYYPGMKKKQVATYEVDKIGGVVLDYYENGVQKKSTSYNRWGEQEGLVVSWYPSGNLMEEFSVNRMGERVGIAKIYYPSGQLEKEVSFKAGVYSGQEKSYYENGQLKESGEYVSGEKNGIWKDYAENGVLVTSYTYFAGERYGVYSEHYQNGQLWKQGELFDDRPTGAYEEYYENGHLKMKGAYSFGMKIGPWVENYEDGSPKSSGVYNNDSRSGKWSEWDAAGKRHKTKY